MTAEHIKNWSRLRGLSEADAKLELRFFGDIIASNKKRPASTERSKDMIPNFSIEQIGW